MKTKWQARPENRDKPLSFRQLRDEFAKGGDEGKSIVDWDSAPPSCEVALVEVEHFDARGMQRVFGRGDHFGQRQSFHIDIWRARDGRFFMRCWSRCQDISWRSFEIQELAAIGSESGSRIPWSESSVPDAVRQAYDQWIREEI